jgi:putative toxin-antitoxin system antitoxin component (TIGR02293 family)
MTTVETVAFLGGEKVFGRPVVSDLELADVIVHGFPSASLDFVLLTLQSEMISQTSIYEMVGSVRTLQRKRQQQTPLSREESDRLTRLARVAVRAAEALGSSDKGHRWLGKPNRALDGKRPMDLLATEVGARLVEDVLGRIEHGVFS